MYSVLSAPSCTNVTFADNDANGYGGAIFHNVGAAVLVNTIAWGNNSVVGPDVYHLSGPPLISFSLIEGSGGSGSGWVPDTGTDGGGNLDANPLFVDVLAGNVRLGTGSPAVDSGDDTAPNLPATDLDGNPRIIGGAVDMGAYELEVATAVSLLPLRGGRVAIRSAYPNPFNPSVAIEFDLKRSGFTEVVVYDARGRFITRLATGMEDAGPHVIRWDGTDAHSNPVASGSYFVVVRSGDSSDQRSLILLK